MTYSNSVMVFEFKYGYDDSGILRGDTGNLVILGIWNGCTKHSGIIL